jgi:hypothetical protein
MAASSGRHSLLVDMWTKGIFQWYLCTISTSTSHRDSISVVQVNWCFIHIRDCIGAFTTEHVKDEKIVRRFTNISLTPISSDGVVVGVAVSVQHGPACRLSSF